MLEFTLCPGLGLDVSGFFGFRRASGLKTKKVFGSGFHSAETGLARARV